MLPAVSTVTDETFSSAVVERSHQVPVVVDLWAEWCGPCKTLGPILEKVIGETNGLVELVKVDVDANPRISQAFAVQSIPAVFALVDGKIVDSFVGALPENKVREFVEKLAPASSDVRVVELPTDEPSLREMVHADATNLEPAVALATLLLDTERASEAVEILSPLSSHMTAKTLLARARLAVSGVRLDGDVDLTLEHLLEQAGTDPASRGNLLEMLDALGPEDPRYVSFRRRLASRLN